MTARGLPVRARAITFDCYGTLVDWETGIAAAFASIWVRRGLAPPGDAVLESFARHEAQLESEVPIVPYHLILVRAATGVGRDLGVELASSEAEAFADSIGGWPLFGDVLPALRELRAGRALAILSNVDHRSFDRTLPRFDGLIDVACIAEDTGAYKPSPAAFEALLDALARRGIARDEVVHVAQSLFHDHAPAIELGIASVWLDRRHGRSGWGAVPPPAGEVMPAARIEHLGELVALLR